MCIRDRNTNAPIHRAFFERMASLDVDVDPPPSRVTAIMGRDDETVPFEFVERHWRSWEASGRLAPGSRFIEIPDGDHGRVAQAGLIEQAIVEACGVRQRLLPLIFARAAARAAANMSGSWRYRTPHINSMRMIAITRDVPSSIEACELTYREPQRIDVVMARAQHHQYRNLLASLGCEVISLPADDAYPDSVFVEDTAIVLDDLAVITRPGAESRRGETRAIADALAPYRQLVHIEAPATIDGGDVLVLDDRIYVGLSTRTNEAAIAQLRFHTRREVVPVDVGGALHLKSAVTRVSPDALLVNRAWIDVAPFAGWTLIDAEEPNALLVGDVVIYPSAFPSTARELRSRGIDVRTVDASELAKAEGGVTCCSLLVKT